MVKFFGADVGQLGPELQSFDLGAPRGGMLRPVLVPVFFQGSPERALGLRLGFRRFPYD